MDTDKLSFLGGEQPSEPEPATEAQPAPEPQASETPLERPRAPDGKFAPATPPEAPQAPSEAAQTPQPPLSEKETVGFYKAMAEERDKRQALERQLNEIKAREEAARPSEPLPLEAQVQQALYKANLDNSRKWAVKEYGKEAVEKAFEWANARCEPTSPQFDPVFNSQVASSGDPYETAVQAYNREQLLAEAGQTDLAEFRAWKASQGVQTAQPTPTPAPQAPPPRSLADASGTGGMGKAHIPVHEGAAFDALPFNKG